MAKKNIADKYWIYGEDAELAARLTSYLTRVVYNQRANYIRALMKIKEHECSIEDCDSDIESQSMRSGNSLEESIESKLMWEAIRKYLPKLELKECEVMIALYIDRLSVTATAAKLPVRSGAAVTAPVTKFAKQWRKNKMGMFKNTLLLAQQGNEKAMEKLLNRYDPLLKKCSIIQGHFDEDLYQSLILEFVRAVSTFKN